MLSVLIYIIKLECHRKSFYHILKALTGILLPGGQNSIQRWEFQCGGFGQIKRLHQLSSGSFDHTDPIKHTQDIYRLKQLSILTVTNYTVLNTYCEPLHQPNRDPSLLNVMYLPCLSSLKQTVVIKKLTKFWGKISLCSKCSNSLLKRRAFLTVRRSMQHRRAIWSSDCFR